MTARGPRIDDERQTPEWRDEAAAERRRAAERRSGRAPRGSAPGAGAVAPAAGPRASAAADPERRSGAERRAVAPRRAAAAPACERLAPGRRARREGTAHPAHDHLPAAALRSGHGLQRLDRQGLLLVRLELVSDRASGVLRRDRPDRHGGARASRLRRLAAGRAPLALRPGHLLVVLVPGIGTSVNGARRWIIVAGFSYSPSELAKLAWSCSWPASS